MPENLPDDRNAGAGSQNLTHVTRVMADTDEARVDPSVLATPRTGSGAWPQFLFLVEFH